VRAREREKAKEKGKEREIGSNIVDSNTLATH
jgi:hypothetical protein